MGRADESGEIVESSGLLGGVTAWQLRVLVENPWEGGGGYTWEQVGRMTLDQIFGRLCDKEFLKRKVGDRTQKIGSVEVPGMLKPNKDGLIKGRAADGTVLWKKVGGKSVARQLMEAEERKKQREKR